MGVDVLSVPIELLPRQPCIFAELFSEESLLNADLATEAKQDGLATVVAEALVRKSSYRVSLTLDPDSTTITSAELLAISSKGNQLHRVTREIVDDTGIPLAIRERRYQGKQLVETVDRNFSLIKEGIDVGAAYSVNAIAGGRQVEVENREVGGDIGSRILAGESPESLAREVLRGDYVAERGFPLRKAYIIAGLIFAIAVLSFLLFRARAGGVND
jgi:hypothetical protein